MSLISYTKTFTSWLCYFNPPLDGAVASPTCALCGAKRKKQAWRQSLQDKVFLPEYLYKCWGFCFLLNLNYELLGEWAKGGFTWNTLICTDSHLASHKDTHTPMKWNAQMHFAPFLFLNRQAHIRKHIHTSLSCNISLSFCSSRPSSWWMVISASASLLVCSWSSSAAREDRPLLCNISSNFFMDSSLL